LVFAAVEPARLDDQVVALDIAERRESGSQCIEPRRLGRGRAKTEIADPINLASRRGAQLRRSGQDRAAAQSDECPSFHEFRVAPSQAPPLEHLIGDATRLMRRSLLAPRPP